jgi:ankyrin repeat protein
MSLLALPDEVLLMVVRNVGHAADLNSLVRSSHRLYAIANQILYRREGAKALVWAAEFGNNNTARMALVEGASVQNQIVSTDDVRGLALMTAAECGYASIIKLIFDMRRGTFDPNVTDPSGSTCLSIAAKEGHLEAVKVLMDEPGVNINQQDVWGCTPIIYSILARHDRTSRLLLSNPDIDLNVVHHHKPLIQHAVERGNAAIVLRLLANKKIKIDSGTQKTLVRLAITFRHAEITGMLLTTFPNIDFNSSDRNEPSMFVYAVSGGDFNIIRMLLSAGKGKIDLNCRDTWGRTPLMIATTRETASVVRLLLQQPRIDPNLCDLSGGATPLIKAVKRRRTTLAKIILEHPETDIDQQNDEGVTPLIAAVKLPSRPLTRLLLKMGADITIKDNDGQSALTHAVIEGNGAVLTVLLAHPTIDINIRYFISHIHLFLPIKVNLFSQITVTRTA